ncbi:hypothetical protein NQ314_005611 [Rhamnusium bicolor]|uniref:GIY-YIG homing endonuclease n=1 Tax=Rhamnusium bicolor TaxID=1586634 RepID=A0AAV8ZHF8_9CUCU|nr:hypothetical protein NQ314_005611 [Rhamnusium bicolor]
MNSYNYCGPGTKLSNRLARHDTSVSHLNEFYKEHNIAYSHSKGINSRHRVEKVLPEKAYQRFKASDSSIEEKTASLGVSGILKVKTKLGMGMRKKRSKQAKTSMGMCRRLRSRQKHGRRLINFNTCTTSTAWYSR